MADLKHRALISVQERLRDRVAHALRAALISGELRPGRIYSAPALAADLGVSATPVREAMLDLAREGLVEPIRNRGFLVTELTDRDLDEYTEVRTLIEVPTVGRVVRIATAEQLERLRPQAEAIIAAAREHDLIGYLEADRRFHLDLLGLAGNAHLVELVGELRNRSRLYGLARVDRAGLLVSSAEEHLELLDLMIAGEAEGAQAYLAHHLGHIRSLWADDPTPATAAPAPGPGRRRAGRA
jgi:DNA-binding GntR family transcriptional regulator